MQFSALFQQTGLTGIAIVASAECVAGAITVTARCAVAAAIVAEAAFLAARLSCALTADLAAEILGMPMAFLVAGMAVAAVR